MKIKFYTLGLLVMVLLMAGCKSAGKLYEKGDYDGAVEVAVKKLQKKPNDEELKTLMREAYRFAVNDREQKIRNLSNNSNELKWEWMYNEYAALQKMHDAIRRSPEAMKVVTPQDYSSYLETYAAKAGDVHYNRAMEWMNGRDRNSIKNAYREFRAAYGFTPTTDVKRKMDEAYDAAVLHVVIMPMDYYNNSQYGGGNIFNNGYQYSNYGMRSFEEAVTRNLRYNTGNEFVKFFSQWDARSQNIRPDHFADMRFSRFNSGRAYDQTQSRQVSKQVVIKEIVYRPDSIVKEYGTVYATITTTKRTMVSEGNLQINIRDTDGRWIWSDELRGEHRWATEFASYTGDARALSEADKELVNRRPQTQPREEDIIRKIMDDLDDDVTWRIRNFYSRY